MSSNLIIIFKIIDLEFTALFLNDKANLEHREGKTQQVHYECI
jgi:hypothetical protein